PADHPAAPQVVSGGGKVLTTPKVVTITYNSDPHQADLDAAVSEMAATSFWAETTAEYGVGPLTVLPPIHLADAAPKSLTDTTLEATLAANLSGNSPAWGAADPSAIYLFVLPEGTVIDAGGNCCEYFDGYHADVKVGTSRVAYAVACTCPGFDGPKVSDLEQVTVVMSHEMVEAATDPFLKPAFLQADDDHAIWSVLTGGETSDLCTMERDAYYTVPGAQYMIQRSWSNAAAAAGHDPCVPHDPGPYFTAAPVLPDKVTIDNFGAVSTRGVKIPVGSTKSIDVVLFSDAPTDGPWDVAAYDVNSELFGDKPLLDLSLDKTSGQNGDTLKLTIKTLGIDSTFGGAAFMLASTKNGQENLWFGVVTK
ncbi:MAG: hypothetical protein U0359_06185, partial [Byssovorax sp.]